MAVPVRGRVHGSSIELEAPLPQLEGRRVLVRVEPEEPEPAAADLHDAWDRWVLGREQGPIEDEGEPEFP
jgi:hypothetical protein